MREIRAFLWRPATIRLDTYSGAPVDFAAYAVDPADVIVAGQSRYPRPLDTARRKPVVRWRFSPPPGYRFQSSDVPVPLGQREGFYVVEARRRDAVQQVWLNRTHVGLLTFESPEGLLVWGVDLRSGRAIGGMNVAFLAGLRLVPKRTDSRGLIAWPDRTLPAFALAEHGSGRRSSRSFPRRRCRRPSSACASIRRSSARAKRFVSSVSRASGCEARTLGRTAKRVYR